MVDILVRNIDEATAARLKAKAKAAGKSVSELAREALASYVKPDRTDMWAAADRLRAKIGRVPHDSTDIIREWRNNAERHR